MCSRIQEAQSSTPRNSQEPSGVYVTKKRKKKVNQMNYNERLMPCPFCGGKANMITITNGSTHHDASFTFGIECSECGTSLPWVHELRATLEDGELKITKDEREKAVEEWNRRITNKKSEEE